MKVSIKKRKWILWATVVLLFGNSVAFALTRNFYILLASAGLLFIAFLFRRRDVPMAVRIRRSLEVLHGWPLAVMFALVATGCWILRKYLVTGHFSIWDVVFGSVLALIGLSILFCIRKGIIKLSDRNRDKRIGRIYGDEEKELDDKNPDT